MFILPKIPMGLKSAWNHFSELPFIPRAIATYLVLAALVAIAIAMHYITSRY